MDSHDWKMLAVIVTSAVGGVVFTSVAYDQVGKDERVQIEINSETTPDGPQFSIRWWERESPIRFANGLRAVRGPDLGASQWERPNIRIGLSELPYDSRVSWALTTPLGQEVDSEGRTHPLRRPVDPWSFRFRSR